MIAVILAGGFAKRLKDNTKYTPKPMLTIGGKTVIMHIVEKIERIPEINKIYILTNSRFKNLFYDFANSYMVSKSKNQIIVIEEPNTYSQKDKFGPLGGLSNFVSIYGINDDILLIGGDNFFTFNLDNLIKKFNKHKKPIVVLKQINDNKYLSTIAVAKIKNGLIKEYQIKPKIPKTNLAGTMIYIIPQEHFIYINKLVENKITDPTGKLIEYLIKNKMPVYGFIQKDGFWADIGSEKVYKKIFNFYNLNGGNFEEAPDFLN